ncbi:MAG: hypothetical protein D6739_06715, partial [Nitrospirae bacterium]
MEWIVYLAAGAAAGLLAGLFGVGGGIVMVPLLDLLFRAQGFAAATRFQCATGPQGCLRARPGTHLRRPSALPSRPPGGRPRPRGAPL